MNCKDAKEYLAKMSDEQLLKTQCILYDIRDVDVILDDMDLYGKQKKIVKAMSDEDKQEIMEDALENGDSGAADEEIKERILAFIENKMKEA